MEQGLMSFVLVSDSENPAEKEDPTFKLTKVHSASTVISNLSLISASMDSDLDARAGDTDGSTHDLTSSKSSSMRAKNSITTRPVKSEAQPSSEPSHPLSVERGSLRALSKSQVLPLNTSKHSNPANSYASFNGHVRTIQKNPSTSSMTDHSRTSSVPDPSDSDIDSYSDIVGNRSWKDPVNNQSVDLSGGNSRQNSTHGAENNNARSWASSPNPTGSVISFGSQQRRVIEDAARTAKQNAKSYESVVNGSRQFVASVNGDGLVREDGPYRGRAPRRSRSESQDPVVQNRSRSAAYSRSKSVPRQRENVSSDEDETEHAHDRRWKTTDSRGSNRMIIGADRTNGTQVLRVSSVDLPARSDSLGSSGNRSTLSRNGDVKTNHAEQLAAEMQQVRRNSLTGRKQSFQRFRDDSLSSQDSTDYESRQTAAEKAAVALMSNHVTHAPPQPLTNKRNPQPLEMRNMGTENRKLRREHLANLANLQSSSC